MKAVESKTTSLAKNTKANQPFFSKEAEGGFFGKSGNEQSDFFKPSSAYTVNGGGVLQTKLTIGQPNDKYEQEADAMADKVAQRLALREPIHNKETEVQAKPLTNTITPLVQAKCAACEKEEKLQKKEEEDLVQELPLDLQRKPIFESDAEPPDDESNIQRKCAECEKEEKLQTKSGLPTASVNIESSLNSSKGRGSPIPAETRQQMESSFGADFSGVRLHTDSSAVQMSKDLNAQAFTHGNDIYFDSGKYNANSVGGKHLLAHELTHVVQQGGVEAKGMINRVPDGGAAEPVTNALPLNINPLATIKNNSIFLHQMGERPEQTNVVSQKNDRPIIQKTPITEEQQTQIRESLQRLGVPVDDPDIQTIHDHFPNGFTPEIQTVFVQVSGANYSSIGRMSAVRLGVATPIEAQVELFVFKVGKGRAILVSSVGGQSILLDAGAGGAVRSGSTAARVLATHINNLTASGLAAPPSSIRISHVDADHFNAISSVLNLPQMGNAIVEITRQQLSQAIRSGNWATMNVQVAPTQRIVQLNVEGTGLDVRVSIIGNMEITEYRSRAAHANLTESGRTRFDKNRTSPVTVIRDRVSNTTYIATADAPGGLLNDVVNMVGEDAFRRIAGGGARNLAGVELPHHGGAVSAGPDVTGMVRFLRLMFESSNGTVNFFTQTSASFSGSTSASIRFLDTADINVERITEDTSGTTSVRNIRGRSNRTFTLNGNEISNVFSIASSTSTRIMEAYQIRDRILTVSDRVMLMERAFSIAPGDTKRLTSALGVARTETATHQSSLDTRLSAYWTELTNAAQATGMRVSTPTVQLSLELSNLQSRVAEARIIINDIEISVAEIKAGMALINRVFLNSLSMQDALRTRDLSRMNQLKGEQARLVDEVLSGAAGQMGATEVYRQIHEAWRTISGNWNERYVQRIATRMAISEADSRQILFRALLAENLSRQMQLNELARRAEEGSLPRSPGAAPTPIRSRVGAGIMAAIELLRIGLDFYNSWEAAEQAEAERERASRIQGLREVYWWTELGVRPEIRLIGRSWGRLTTLDISSDEAYRVVNEEAPEAERPEYERVAVYNVSDEDLQTVVAQFYLRFMKLEDWIDAMGDPKLNDRRTRNASDRWLIRSGNRWSVKLWDSEDDEYKLEYRQIIQQPLEELMVHLNARQEESLGGLREEHQDEGTFTIEDTAWIFGTDREAYVYNSIGNPEKIDFDDFSPTFVKVRHTDFAYRVRGKMAIVRAANMETYRRLIRYYWVRESEQEYMDNTGTHRNYYVINNTNGFALVNISNLKQKDAPINRKVMNR